MKLNVPHAVCFLFVVYIAVEAQSYSLVTSSIGSSHGKLASGTYDLSQGVGIPIVGSASSDSYSDEAGFPYDHNDSPTGIRKDDSTTLTGNTRLRQNFPNPFNPTTTLQFELGERAIVAIDVFDVQGRHVVTVLQTNLHPGVYEVPWDGRNDRGSAVASGIYFARLKAGSQIHTIRMVLLK